MKTLREMLDNHLEFMEALELKIIVRTAATGVYFPYSDNDCRYKEIKVEHNNLVVNLVDINYCENDFYGLTIPLDELDLNEDNLKEKHNIIKVIDALEHDLREAKNVLLNFETEVKMFNKINTTYKVSDDIKMTAFDTKRAELTAVIVELEKTIHSYEFKLEDLK